MENVITKPKDFTKVSIQQILDYFHFEYLNAVDLDNDPNKQQFYCGITCDIDQNLSRHGVKGYMACALCDSYETASKVESLLGEQGFDIGASQTIGNGGNKNSKIVYMIEKIKDFRP